MLEKEPRVLPWKVQGRSPGTQVHWCGRKSGSCRSNSSLGPNTQKTLYTH